MLSASALYKAEMNKPIRNRGYVSISLGVVNQSAQADVSYTADTMYFSNGNIFENQSEFVNYATLEENYTKVDGTFLCPPENDDSSVYEVNGIVTKHTSNNPVRFDFGQSYDIKGLTIDFGSAYPTEFTIETDNGTETYNNDSSVFVTEDVMDDITYIILTPVTMVGGEQRLHIRSILMGVGLVFGNADTQNVDVEQYISAISDEVSYSTYSVKIFDQEHKFDVDNDDSFMAYLEPMQPIKISFGIDLDNGTQEWKQVATAYLREWNSQKGVLSLVATDKLSQLETQFSNNVLEDRTAYAEFETILADCGFEADEYELDDFLQNITIHNPMPEGTHRECLQLLANACRCIIYEDENGILHVKANFETVIDPDDIITTSNDEADWSDVGNIWGGATVVYGDFTTGGMFANEQTFFLPEDSAEYTGTGYVSNSIADYNGEFSTNPYIEITLPALYTYYGLRVNFGGQVPSEVVVKTYNGATLIKTFTFTDLSQNAMLLDDFASFNKMRIEFTKTAPYARVTVNKVAFGAPTDYRLTKDLMLDNPYGYKEQRTKEVRVKIYTYQLNDDNEPELVDDEVYYTEPLAISGIVRTVENPLIDDVDKAQLLAEWIGAYCKNDVSYSVSYRGEPRMQAGDIITMDSDFKNNLQVEVQTNRLSFNGAFSGDLELRRALKMTNTEE